MTQRVQWVDADNRHHVGVQFLFTGFPACVSTNLCDSESLIPRKMLTPRPIALLASLAVLPPLQTSIKGLALDANWMHTLTGFGVLTRGR
jgi:hypothetical protein